MTLGAAHDDEPGVRIHSSYDRGLLSLDAYAFGLAPPFRARSAFVRLRRGGCSTLERPMQLKPVIQGLAAVWLVLFVASFVSLQIAGVGRRPAERARARRRVLTWQVIAFVVAALGAFATRYAVSRGVERVKLVGYVPLALSVFLVASFIALMAVRFYVAPLLEGFGFLEGDFWPIGPGLSGATKMRWMCRSLKRHRPSSPRTYRSTKSATSVGIAGDSGGSPYWPNVMQTDVPRARVALSMSSLSPEYRWRAVRFVVTERLRNTCSSSARPRETRLPCV